VTDGRGASPLGGEVQATEPEFEGVRSHGLPGPAAEEQPAGVGVGGGHGVRALAEVGQQQRGEGLGDG
jgi:hypothetical protein